MGIALSEREAIIQASKIEELSQKPEITSVLDLPEKLCLLSERNRVLAARLFEIKHGGKDNASRLLIPEEMKPWIIENFGNANITAQETIERVENQPLVMIQDRHLKGEASYNVLRGERPQPKTTVSPFKKDIEDEGKRAKCAFCKPQTTTPCDASIGKPSYDGVTIVANVAKFAPVHLLALGEHDPYKTTEHQYKIQIGMLLDCARQISDMNPVYKFLRLGLNRGYRAAGSLVHDHWQGELNIGSMHFPFAERLNEVAYNYSYHYKDVFKNEGADFFNDYFKVHEALGLGIQLGNVKVLSMLVPLKENSVMLIDDIKTGGFEVSDDFIDALWHIQRFMIDEEKAEEYNIFILPRPNRPDSSEYWSKYKTVAVFIDRGSSAKQNADWGYTELSGTGVVSSDPFKFGPRLNKYLVAA